LRRLQYANRPVSNTDSKNRLEQFFTENVSTNNSASARPVRDPKKFRSEATRNEIEELGAQQRVSNVLQNARQRLENALQRIATTAPTRMPIANLPLTPPPPPPQRSTLSQSAVYTNGLQASQNSIASNVSSNLVIHSSDGSTNVFAPVTAWVPITTTQQPVQQQQQQQQENVQVAPAGQWLTTVAGDQLRATIDQVRREQIIEEISELVHQQLVTSTLESEFRSRLEERVMEHLQSSGVDGNRTREYIRNIPQTAHVERNDFSHLGIYNPANVDNLDSASTYQPSQPVQNQQQQQQRQSTAGNTREIRALKTEISELKSMMKLSFELQLDMQRSLKQEISALISGTFKQDSSNTVNNRMRFESTLNSTRPTNEGKCIICTEGSVDTVLYKCGHMCVSRLLICFNFNNLTKNYVYFKTCYVCSMTLKQTGRSCPVCRAPIVDILRTYKCNLE
jgi:hypothetical protein